MRRMRTLQGKLILAFLLVIGLCLVPTSAVAAVIVRNYQGQEELDHLARIGAPITAALTGRTLSQQGQLPSSEDVRALVSQLDPSNIRILIIDESGIVRADSAETLTGKPLRLPQSQFTPQESRGSPWVPVYKNRLKIPDGELLGAAIFNIGKRPLRGGPNSITTSPPATQLGPYVIVAEPWRSIGDAWGVIGGRLRSVLLVALLVAIFLAFALSQSLTSRLRLLTHAAHAIAKGDFKNADSLSFHRRYGDEVDNLADAFRVMATNVARTQQSQRDFVSNVSHELKTPLTSIQGFSQAIVDGTVEAGDEQRELAGIILHESQRMIHLVERTLELARLESGGKPLQSTRFVVSEFVSNLGRRYARIAQTKDVTISWASHGTTTLEADVGQIEQVLINLLDNALQYTNAGGTVTLEASQTRRPGVMFVVRDNGQGIPEGDIPRLFERFYQVDRARAGPDNHVGLGLAIVQEIVEIHGGDIVVESSVGRGTEIRVTIPDGTIASIAASSGQRTLQRLPHQ